MKTRLTDQDYANAAIRLNTGIAEVKAVTAVESGGRGFTVDDLCIIRFEPHIFSRYTKRSYDLQHPTLSFDTRKIGYPKDVNQSWRLFNEAAKLDPKAAVQATSWGLFQIMGFNFSLCDCETLTEFVRRMEESELQQLILFCNFIISTGLDDELREHKWAEFARMYNGLGYKTNQYDTRLEAAYKKFL